MASPFPASTGFIQQIKQAGKGAVLRLDILRHGERNAISVGLGGAEKKPVHMEIANSASLLIAPWERNSRTRISRSLGRRQNGVGVAFRRITGQPGRKSGKAAIEAYRAALSVLSREASPQDWGAAQNNLGIAYEERIRGSRAENLEAAIEAYEAALTVRTREAFPQAWAADPKQSWQRLWGPHPGRPGGKSGKQPSRRLRRP